jgi:hypothetical protein
VQCCEIESIVHYQVAWDKKDKSTMVVILQVNDIFRMQDLRNCIITFEMWSFFSLVHD